jgi:hypothetical protein
MGTTVLGQKPVFIAQSSLQATLAHLYGGTSV